MRFVSEMEGKTSELDFAKEMGFEIDEDDLARAVIHRLRNAIKHVKKNPLEDDKVRTLYHIANYAKAIGKPEFGIALCHIVNKDSTTREEYRELASQWLEGTKLILPEEVYNQHLKDTVFDVDQALDESYDWLKVQRKHATQPVTKNVFTDDLIKKSDQAET